MPNLLTRLATAEASLGVQLALLVLHAVLWHVLTTRAAQRIAPWCRAQPWIERFRARAGSTLRRGYGIQFEEEEDMFALVTLVAATLCVHVTGGLLCVPAVLARRPTPLVVRLCGNQVQAPRSWRGARHRCGTYCLHAIEATVRHTQRSQRWLEVLSKWKVATDRRRGGSQSAPHRSSRWRRTVHW